MLDNSFIFQFVEFSKYGFVFDKAFEECIEISKAWPWCVSELLTERLSTAVS